MSEKKKNILFIQPSVNPPGGGNGVAAWMLHGLCQEHNVTLLTLDPFSAALTDEYYGTSIGLSGLENICCSTKLGSFLKHLPIKTGLIQLHLAMRQARKAAKAPWDLICTAFDEQDLGKPCLEYVHYPWNLYPRPDAPPGWNESWWLPLVLKVYNRLCCLLSGFNMARRPKNYSLVNSNWTGSMLQKAYPNTSYKVLYPPALAEALSDDRKKREERFLTIGRVAPSKEWEKLIDIVAGLRRLGHDVSLTLAGSNDRYEYKASIEKRIAQEGSWVELITDFSRDKLQELFLTHQYGLHGMKEEHYGMAVAELVLGGCLTMVPNDGGQVEIVTNPMLRYDSCEEAIKKWDEILKTPELKNKLLKEQLNNQPELGKERFLKEFKAIVDRCLELGIEQAQAEMVASRETSEHLIVT